MRHRIGVGALAGALVLGLGACGSPNRVAEPPADTGPHPVVTGAQAERVIAAVDLAFGRALKQRDRTLLRPRVTGPQKSITSAELSIGSKTKAKPSGAVAGRPLRMLVPAMNGWPRFFISVEQPAASRTAQEGPLLRVFRSEDPRSPYALWAELPMLPGATLPEVAAVEDGAPALHEDAPGYAIDLDRVGAAYADVLNRGATSSFAASFAADAYRSESASRLAEIRRQVAKVATAASRHKAAGGDEPVVMILRAADGSALVISMLRHDLSIAIKPKKGKVTVPAELGALAGRRQFAKRLTRSTVEVVAFVVPREGAGDQSKVRVIAVQRGDVSAKGS